MSLLTSKIDAILKAKNLTRYKLSKMTDCNESALNQMARGEIPFSDKFKERILPVLGISKEEFEIWIVADKYSKEVLQLAIEAKKSSRMDCQPIKILTTRLDEILKNKNMSRTQLSKLIKHSQSGLNRVIIGKEPLSKKVLTKLANAFELPEDEIKSWVIADKYPLQILESALNLS